MSLVRGQRGVHWHGDCECASPANFMLRSASLYARPRVALNMKRAKNAEEQSGMCNR
jgi:hypothetical protein